MSRENPLSATTKINMVLEKARNTIKKYELINKGDKILVAVSGGPDSVALLYLLNSLRSELRINLHIAHLDHRLRKGSYKDKGFVEKLAKQLKLPVTTAQINVRELAKKGSLEEIARNARLGFLFRVAKDVKANKIALGHNLDDQAETVLMRILRGTGLYGLSGILPKRSLAGFKIIRPLIAVKRKEIEKFLKKRKVRTCIDRSNLEGIYLRNRIRNRLLPLLQKEYNRNIKEVLSNMAESIGYDYDYLNQRAALAIKRLTSRQRIEMDKYLSWHPAIQRLVLRLMIAKIKGDMRGITFQHIKEIEDLIFQRPINSIVDLPKGISVVKKKKYLSFYQR